jgi:hypothetical protein
VTQPWTARLLSRLIRGPDAEGLQGDLEESWQRRVAGRPASLAVRLTHLADVAASVIAWWWSRATGGFTQGMGSELRYVVRGILRRPGYASIVIITLGLGIGATTTIYTVVDALYVRPLPYPDAPRLAVIGNTVPGEEWVRSRAGLQRVQPMSLPNAMDLATRLRSFERVEAMERANWLTMTPGGVPEVLQVGIVTAGFFDLLSVQASRAVSSSPEISPSRARATR